MDASQVAQSPDISDVVKRFFRYVQVDSPSNPDREEITPSNEEELAMAALLGKELEELGAKDVKVDEHGYVTAKLDARPRRRAWALSPISIPLRTPPLMG